MLPSHASPMVHISYWEFFQQYYTPLLREIDLLLKTIEAPISVAKTAKLLAMEPKAVKEITAKEDIQLIDREGFLQIMMHGNSSLCRLMQRECTCGSPDYYSPAQIAYIYGLQDGNVESAFRANDYDAKIPACDLPKLLSKIYIYIIR